MTVTELAVPVLYLDIDGTVRQGKDDALGRFVNGPEDVVVFPEAVDRMMNWKQGGGSSDLEGVMDRELTNLYPHPSLGHPWEKTYVCPSGHENKVIYYKGDDE